MLDRTIDWQKSLSVCCHRLSRNAIDSRMQITIAALFVHEIKLFISNQAMLERLTEALPEYKAHTI
jgi:hypothetical protein